MRKAMILGLAALFATTGLAAPAEARRKAARVVVVKTAQAFKAADTDQSRQLSADEFAAAGGNAANFASIDRNANGTLGFLEMLMAAFGSLKAKRAG
jgi:hypothetical protein